MSRNPIIVAVALLLALAGCNSEGAGPSSAKAITAYSLAGVAGAIDESGSAISVTLPSGTAVTALVATFTTTGVKVSVGAVVQTSGATANDFTAPVVYTVAARDASTADYTVTVAVAPAASLADVPKTGQTVSYAAGDDGEQQKGIAWPSPRFTNSNDGTITDHLTGLIWTQDGLAPGPAACEPGAVKAWQLALNYVACLDTNNYLGHSDWRLPNRNELHSLIDHGQADVAAWLNTQGFTRVQSDYYWSSTTFAPDSSRGWIVLMSDGSVVNQNREYGNKFDKLWAWPVRTGAAGTIELPRTGQTTSYAAGDDGDLQRGGLRPAPRFTDNGDQTVTDLSTGLIWTRDGNPTPPAACTSGHTWLGSLDYVACLNANAYLGHADWRMPDIAELDSLNHSGQANIAAWLNTQGFTNVHQDYYWSSTTYGPNTVAAWIFEMGTGVMGSYGKSPVFAVWPVRAGR